MGIPNRGRFCDFDIKEKKRTLLRIYKSPRAGAPSSGLSSRDVYFLKRTLKPDLLSICLLSFKHTSIRATSPKLNHKGQGSKKIVKCIHRKREDFRLYPAFFSYSLSVYFEKIYFILL